jgi:hypothetical protein
MAKQLATGHRIFNKNNINRTRRDSVNLPGSLEIEVEDQKSFARRHFQKAYTEYDLKKSNFSKSQEFIRGSQKLYKLLNL